MSNITEGELLEALLNTENSSELSGFKSKELLSMYNSLSGVLYSDIGELKALFGLSNQQIKIIRLVKEIVTHVLERKLSSETSISAPEYLTYLKLHLSPKNVEGLYAMLFTVSRKYICTELLSAGTNDQVALNHNEALRIILNKKAKYIVLAHNHPNGYAMPSMKDRDFTKALSNTLSQFNIFLIDHVIIGGNKVYSIFNKKMITNLKEIPV